MFKTYPPPPQLAPFVDYFWYHSTEASLTSVGGVAERALPIGTPELVITLGGEDISVSGVGRPTSYERTPKMVFRGAYSQWYRIALQSVTTWLGVQFKPGGAAPFLPMPADELKDLCIDLETLWGRRAAELYEQLLELPTPGAQVRLLAHTMIAQALSAQARLSKVGRPLEHHPAVAQALHAFHTAPLAQMVGPFVEQIGLSHRYFNTLFRAEVGLAPKQFCNVRRFQAALHFVQQRYPVTWTEVALAHGYYDQSHLIRDFQLFAGMSPTEYLRHRYERFFSVVRDLPLINNSGDAPDAA